MASRYADIRELMRDILLLIGGTLGGIVLGAPFGLLWTSSKIAELAHHRLTFRRREARLRKVIKSSSPKGFRTFTVFGSLPKELQLAIWELAVQDIGPRTIKLQLFWWGYKVPKFGYSNILGTVVTARQKYKTEIPQLLRACHDAREVAQRRYKLSFGKLLQGRPVYFNIDTDTLWVTSRRDAKFPIELLAMDGWHSLIITSSEKVLPVRETRRQSLVEWRKNFFRNGGHKKRIQVVWTKGSLFSKDDAKIVKEAIDSTFADEDIAANAPPVTIVCRDELDFRGGSG